MFLLKGSMRSVSLTSKYWVLQELLCIQLYLIRLRSIANYPMMKYKVFSSQLQIQSCNLSLNRHPILLTIVNTSICFLINLALFRPVCTTQPHTQRVEIRVVGIGFQPGLDPTKVGASSLFIARIQLAVIWWFSSAVAVVILFPFCIMSNLALLWITWHLSNAVPSHALTFLKSTIILRIEFHFNGWNSHIC